MVSATLLMLVPYGHHLRYPVVTMCCGDPAVLGQQDQSLPIFHQILGWVDIGMRQLITIVLGLGRCTVGVPTCSPLSRHQVSYPALSWVVNYLWGMTRVLISHHRVDSPTPPLSGKALIYCPGKVQGPISQVYS